MLSDVCVHANLFSVCILYTCYICVYIYIYIHTALCITLCIYIICELCLCMCSRCVSSCSNVYIYMHSMCRHCVHGMVHTCMICAPRGKHADRASTHLPVVWRVQDCKRTGKLDKAVNLWSFERDFPITTLKRTCVNQPGSMHLSDVGGTLLGPSLISLLPHNGWGCLRHAATFMRAVRERSCSCPNSSQTPTYLQNKQGTVSSSLRFEHTNITVTYCPNVLLSHLAHGHRQPLHGCPVSSTVRACVCVCVCVCL